MINKIILTTLLIAGLLYYLRSRNGPQAQERRPRGQEAERPTSQRPLIPRSILYIFIGLMLLATSVILYFEWEKGYRVVTVRVINADTGQVVEYQARRGDIRGRTFETLDGRLVTLADVERMELDLSDGSK